MLALPGGISSARFCWYNDYFLLPSFDSDRDLRLVPSAITGPAGCWLLVWRHDDGSADDKLLEPDDPCRNERDEEGSGGRLADPEGTGARAFSLVFFLELSHFFCRELELEVGVGDARLACSSATPSVVRRASSRREFQVLPLSDSATLRAMSAVRNVAKACPLF